MQYFRTLIIIIIIIIIIITITMYRFINSFAHAQTYYVCLYFIRISRQTFTDRGDTLQILVADVNAMNEGKQTANNVCPAIWGWTGC
jgi:hypothetical protein